MAVRTASKTAAPKASRSQARSAKTGATKKGPAVSAGADESGDDDFDFGTNAEPDFGTVEATPAKAAARKAGKKAAAPKGGEFTVPFILNKETTGSGQYAEVDENGDKVAIKDGFVGSIYIRKDKVGGTLPQTLTVTVKY